ncbi:MAG: hypothetical protein K6F34_01350 [Lachnospiraceae bacterium]|nr:hypothetical protein [Lachnospiraceae bacterium]
MRLVTIDKSYIKKYSVDSEMLQKAERPCALIIQMTFRGHRYDFAIPLRSNICASAPKEQYFPLPPRRTTKDKKRHGLHYIKMFPVKRQWLRKFHTDTFYSALIKGIIDKNEKIIIAECKTYLRNYENGMKPSYSTDLDMLIEIMNSE